MREQKKNGDEHKSLIDITNYKRSCVNSGQYQVCYIEMQMKLRILFFMLFFHSHPLFCKKKLHNHFPLAVKLNSILCAEAEEVK